MGIAYRSDAATGLSVSVWDGDVDVEERRRHMATLATDANWASGGLVLTDLRGISPESRPTAESVLDAADSFVRNLADQARSAKWAVVAATTLDEARRFGAYVEEAAPGLMVFDDLGEAWAWLEVEPGRAGAVVDELRQELRSGG